MIAVLTDSDNPRNYWKVLKSRLKKEGNQTVTNCNQLKLCAEDGKMRMTDVADQEQLFRSAVCKIRLCDKPARRVRNRTKRVKSWR